MDLDIRRVHYGEWGDILRYPPNPMFTYTLETTDRTASLCARRLGSAIRSWKNTMHNILRAYVTATRLLIDATEDQIDDRGRSKAVATAWAEMPLMSGDVIHIAEQLREDPSLASGEPHQSEEGWLKAVIDEVATTGSEPAHSTEESWATLARAIAWLAFCLKQATSYAEDKNYGNEAFYQIRSQIEAADEFEKSLVVSAVTGATAHLDSTRSPATQEIVAVYDELVRGLA